MTFDMSGEAGISQTIVFQACKFKGGTIYLDDNRVCERADTNSGLLLAGALLREESLSDFSRLFWHVN